MKPLGWFSERGGTTFAGEGGRHIEKASEAKIIDSGVLEHLNNIIYNDPDEYEDPTWDQCQWCFDDLIYYIDGEMVWCQKCCPGFDKDLEELDIVIPD